MEKYIIQIKAGADVTVFMEPGTTSATIQVRKGGQRKQFSSAVYGKDIESQKHSWEGTSRSLQSNLLLELGPSPTLDHLSSSVI